MVKVGIIVAMDSEYDMVQSNLANINIDSNTGFCKGQLGDISAILCKSGIGKVNAAIAAYELIKSEHPDYIINTGVAGSIMMYGVESLMNEDRFKESQNGSSV